MATGFFSLSAAPSYDRHASAPRNHKKAKRGEMMHIRGTDLGARPIVDTRRNTVMSRQTCQHTVGDPMLPRGNLSVPRQ